MTCSNGGRLRCHLPVRGDDRRLAVAVPVAAFVVQTRWPRELLLDQLARRARELALLVAPVDSLLEGDVRALLARVLGGEERDVRQDEDRGVEQDEPRDELGRARRELEGEPAAERVADEDRGLGPDRLDDRVEVRPMIHGGSYGEEPWPSRSGARTWKPGSASASFAKWRPWLVTPCRQTTRGASGGPHSSRCERSHGLVERVERLRDHLRPPLVLHLHERPDHACRPCRSGTSRGAARRSPR